MADNRCVRIYDLKQKVMYNPDIGTYILEEDIDEAETVIIPENETNDWKDFNIKTPNEIGLYVVKVESHPFDYDGVSHSVMRWDGEDFLLPIGRPITDEVLYWKKI